MKYYKENDKKGEIISANYIQCGKCVSKYMSRKSIGYNKITLK